MSTRRYNTNAEYTNEELKEAIADEEDNLQSLRLDERESILKVRLQEKSLEEGEVFAKMDGVVRKVGDVSKPPADGSAFIQVVGSNGLFVQGNLSEEMLDTIQEGDVITVQSWQTGRTWTAEITEISPYPSREYFEGYEGRNSEASSYPFFAKIQDPEAMISQNEGLQLSFGSAETIAAQMRENNTLYLYKPFVLDDVYFGRKDQPSR